MGGEAELGMAVAQRRVQAAWTLVGTVEAIRWEAEADAEHNLAPSGDESPHMQCQRTFNGSEFKF